MYILYVMIFGSKFFVHNVTYSSNPNKRVSTPNKSAVWNNWKLPQNQ